MAREFANKFYHTKEWQTTREHIMKRDNYLCVKCGQPAEEVHHIIHLTPINVHDPSIALGENNLISLCRDCHFAIHRESIRQHMINLNKAKKKPVIEGGYMFDEEGQFVPITKKIYIVYGSPGSGKTTYVREHMKAGDMVVDLDLIKQAISMQGKTEATDDLLDVVIEVRELLYDLIEDKKVKAESIWIVAGLPRKKQRIELMERFNAELIHVDTCLQECIRRALNDDDRVDKGIQMEVISKWWGMYEE